MDRLYSEDADWNDILTEHSTAAVTDHAKMMEFLDNCDRLDSGENDEIVEIDPKILKPKFSAVVY